MRRRFGVVGGVLATLFLAAILFAPGIPHVFATGAPNWGSYYQTTIAPYNMACSSSVDQSGAINAAINDASAYQAGTTVVIGPCSSAIALSSSIVLKSNVKLDLAGARFIWIGAANGNMLSATSASSMTIQGNRATFDCNNVSGATGVYLNMTGDSTYANFAITNCNVGLWLAATGTGNNVDQQFSKISQTFNNTAIYMAGTVNSGGVTDNRFYDMICWKCHQKFVNIAQATDNEYFFGAWVEFDSPNAVAFDIGSSCSPCGGQLPGGNRVDSNWFTDTAIEFENMYPSIDVRLGNGTTGTSFKRLWDPEITIATSTLVVDNGATDYYIERNDYYGNGSALNAHYVRQKGQISADANIGVCFQANGNKVVVVRANDNTVQYKYAAFGGTSWSAWTSLGQTATSDPTCVGGNNGCAMEIVVRDLSNNLVEDNMSSGCVWSGWRYISNNP